MRIDGRQLAENILENLSKRVHNLKRDYHVIPHLAVIRVGDDPAITSYIAQKEKMSRKIGAVVSVYTCPTNTSHKEILQAIHFLQEKGDIHGIIVQLPLPKVLNEAELIAAIDPARDVDGFHPKTTFTVPIAAAVMTILKEVYVLVQKKMRGADSSNFLDWLKNQTIVVIGKGPTGGQPVIDHLQKLGLHPTIIDSKTQHPELMTKTADIIISAVGKKGIITKEHIKKDAVLISIGMGMDDDGQFFGDYDEKNIKDKAGLYTPIPGGVGPVNVAKLMENLIIATENQVRN